MKHSEEVCKIVPALVKAQSLIKSAAKDTANPFFKSKYADLASVWEVCREPLSANGLAVTQDVTLEERGVAVSTRIWHESGEWMEFGPLVVLLSKEDAQGEGSATSYGRRYGLSAALSIVTDQGDDDGNGATGKPAGKTFMERMKRDESSPAGISAMRTKVNAACLDVAASTDWDTLEGWLNQPDTKRLAIAVCRDYPTLWRGDEPGSGLAGCIEVAGESREHTKSVDEWIDKVVAASRKVA